MGNPIYDLMYRGESGAAGYNAYNRGTYIDANNRERMRPLGPPTDFSQYTLGEILEMQHRRSSDPERVFALGKYQIIPKTMNAAVRYLHLDPNQHFTPELQDRIFSEYLLREKQPDVNPYITGQQGASLQAAQLGLAQEWASFPDPNKGGRSHYGGANQAHITLEQSAVALTQLREQYHAAISQGMSRDEAWRVATVIDPEQRQIATAPSRTADDPTIHALQQNLNQLGITDAEGRPLVVDGNRGGPNSRTNAAIATFERQFGFEGNQVSNAELLAATQVALRTRQAPGQSMGDVLPEDAQDLVPATPTPQPPLRIDPISAPQRTATPSQPALSEDVVRTLQRQLNDLGVRDERGQPLEARSGIYGSHTAAAVRTFQQGQGLPATGVADDATRSTINAHAIVARLQQDKAAREAQTATTPLAPMAPTLETADLHARLHPDHTGHDALRSTYATAAPVVNTVAPRRAADQPDQFGPMQPSAVPVSRQAGEQAPQPALANAQAALHPGDRGPEVWTLQDALIRSGVNQSLPNPVQAHGAYDQATQRGVMAFQLRQGLEPTGIADAVTRQTVQQQAVRAVEHAQAGPSLTPTLTEYAASTPPVQQAPAAPAPEAPSADVNAHWQQQRVREQQARMLVQARQEEDKRREEEPTRQTTDPLAASPSQMSKPLSIEDHPALPGIRQALCDKLEQQGQLAGVSDDRLTAIAGQLHQRGLQAYGRWAATIRNDTFFAQGQELAKSGVLVKLDLSQPSASPEQTLQEVATFDRQQALDAQARQEQRQREQDDPGRRPTM